MSRTTALASMVAILAVAARAGAQTGPDASSPPRAREEPLAPTVVLPDCDAADPCSPYGAASDGSNCSRAEFGRAFADAGDQDGDGRADLWVGAPRADDPTLAFESDVGEVALISGKTRSRLWVVRGDAIGARMGTSLASLGDVDGDGRSEVAVGVPQIASGGCAAAPGRVVVLAGSGGQALYEISGSLADRFGGALAAIADVDGDGVRELAIGAELDGATRIGAGAVHVVSGASGAAIASVRGTIAFQRFGASLAALGDVDGDGVDDLAVGAPGPSKHVADGGGVRLIRGGAWTTMLAINGASAGERFGASVSGGGDVDGDGARDWIVGAPGASSSGPSTGAAYVFRGSGELVFEVRGDVAGEELGRAVAILPDVDGDGRAEFAVGAPRADRADATACGRVRIHRGSDATVLAEWLGARSGDRLGDAVGAIGDVGGDGVANDLAASAWLADRAMPAGSACARFTDSGELLLLAAP